jgi:hypothetical protein
MFVVASVKLSGLVFVVLIVFNACDMALALIGL